MTEDTRKRVLVSVVVVAVLGFAGFVYHSQAVEARQHAGHSALHAQYVMELAKLEEGDIFVCNGTIFVLKVKEQAGQFAFMPGGFVGELSHATVDRLASMHCEAAKYPEARYLELARKILRGY